MESARQGGWIRGTFGRALALVAVLWLPASAADRDAPSAEDLEFFERSVRPLLVEHCLECHGAEKQKGGLRMDSRAGWSAGGDSGPALQPGEPDHSRLVAAVRWADPDLQMPPRKRLSEREVGILEEWVRRGAPDPRDVRPGTTVRHEGSGPAATREPHWAYQPVIAPSIPAVRDRSWPATSVDRFVLSALEGQGRHPGPDASDAVQVRRLFLDLTGLPPTVRERERFLSDRSPDRWIRLVDDLLARPEFGEQWARHWFDVVRFAESVTLRGIVFPEAWRYRDYVIDVLNGDVPYPQFLSEQIAGDLLGGATAGERARRCVATTFLALGNTNLEDQDKRQLDLDVVDEQLDVIGKAFLGQTLGCARCHDHKFDPIPTRDYHALAGILASTRILRHANVSERISLPLPLDPDAERRWNALELEQAAVKAELEGLRKRRSDAGPETGRTIPLETLGGVVVDDSEAHPVGDWQVSTHTRPFVGAGYRHDRDASKGECTLTFQPVGLPGGVYEVRFAFTPGSNRASAVPVTVFSADGETTVTVDQRTAPADGTPFVGLGRFRFEAGGQAHVLVGTAGTRGHVVADAVQFLPVVDGVVATAFKEGAPSAAPAADGLDQQVAGLEGRLKRIEAALEGRPRYMGAAEAEVRDLPIAIRGNVHNPGPIVPRGFLSAVPPSAPGSLPAGESGRRELAAWLADSRNPLPSRVWVNRVWHWLMGVGLVPTVDNFGTTGARPSHPELLDHLAHRLLLSVEQGGFGGSTKRLVRELVLSRTYRLAVDAESPEADPDNRWLGRAHRRRLTAEQLRDTMLWLTGALRRDVPGGPGFPQDLKTDFSFDADLPWRSVRLPAFRNARPDLLTLFDGADPNVVTGVRASGVVASQALFLMNHPWVRSCAVAAARRLMDSAGPDPERLDRLYREALGRLPGAKERAVLLSAVADAADPSDRLEAWADVVHAVVASPDFRFVDGRIP